MAARHVLTAFHPAPPLSCAHPCAPHCVPAADFHPLVDSITYSDYYLLANDFPAYIKSNEYVDQVCDGSIRGH